MFGSSPFGGGGNNNNHQQAFGSSAPAFGGGGGNAFGSSQQSTGGGLFGNNNTVGGGSGIGGGALSFGGNNQQRSTTFPASPTLQRGGGMGGGQGQSNLFGQPGQTQNQPFGAAAGTNQPFGASSGGNQPFGASSGGNQPFGASLGGGQNQNQPFGGGGGGNMFGSSGGGLGGGFGQQQQQTGTGNPPYVAPTIKEIIKTNGKEIAVMNTINAITAMPQYASKSFEELRYEDYLKKQGGGQQQQQTAGAFGGNTSGSPFGGQAASAPAASNSPFGGGTAFGSASTNAFGATAAPATNTAFGGGGGAFGGGGTFGSTGGNQQAGAFGSSTAAPQFGTGSATSAFGGGNTSAFGGQQTSSAPAFGQTQSTTQPFGSTAAPAFGAQQSTSAFGAQQSTSAFGAQQSTPAFGAQQSTSPFGAQQSTPAFGAQQSTPAFGAQQSTSAFGAQASGGSNMFGNTGSTPAFGSQQPAANTGFGGTAAAAPAFGAGGFGGSTGFGGAAAAPAANSAFGSFGSSPAATAPAFGSAGAATSAFGSTTAASSFGGGTAAPAFGSAPAGGNAFGGGAGAFGAAPAATANLWGSSAAAKPATTSFGGAAPSTSSFGGSFGSMQQPQQTSTFGGGGGFGQQQQQQPSAFGGGGMFSSSFGAQPQQQQQQQQPAQGGQVAAVANVSTSGHGFDVLDKKFNYLHRKKDDLEKNVYGNSSSASSGVSDNKSGTGGENTDRSSSTRQGGSSLYSGGGGGYRHTPLQQSAIYRSPSLRALSGPQGQQYGNGYGGGFMPRSKSNHQLGSESSGMMGMQYMTPVGHRAGGASSSNSNRYSSNDATSVGGSGGLLFSGAGNSMVVSAAKHPKRLVIESSASSQHREVSVDDMCRRASTQQSAGGGVDMYTPNAKGVSAGNGLSGSGAMRSGSRDRYVSPQHQEVAVVSDDDVEHHAVTPQRDEIYSTPATGKSRGDRSSYKDSGGNSSSNAYPSPALGRGVTPARPPTIAIDSGYITSPDISALRDMDANELRHVYHFTVLRPKFGKIVWEDDCDLSGLDLGDIVKIEHEAVSVYEGDVEKPPVGSALNKPAIVTLYNIKPAEKDGEEKVQKLVSLLKMVCEDDEADFISYDEQNFEWVFKVYHFSRYGLAGARDNDDDQATTAAAPNENSSGAVNGSTSISVVVDNKTSFFVQPPPPASVDNTDAMEVVSSPPHEQERRMAPGVGGLTSALGFDGDGIRRMRDGMQSSPVSRAVDAAMADNNKGAAVAITFQKSFYKDPAVCAVQKSEIKKPDQDAGNNFSDMLLKLSKQAVSASSVVPTVGFCSATMKAAENELGPAAAASSSRSGASARPRRRPDAALLLKSSFRVGFDAWGRVASCSSSNLCVSHLNVGYRGNDSCYSTESPLAIPSAFDEYASRGRAERNDKCFISCLESVLDVSEVHERDDAVDDDATNSDPTPTPTSLLRSPRWLLPDATAVSGGQTGEYVRYVQLMNSIIGNYGKYFNEALLRGKSRSEEPKFSVESMGHDQEWIVLQCVHLLNALFGQEASWLDRIRSGEEGLHLPSMLPCDGEHESCLSTDERTRQYLLSSEGADSEYNMHFGRSQIERRRTAISNWLQDICINFGEKLCCQQNDDSSSTDVAQSSQGRIFDLLSSHRISEAVELAESSGMYRLATLLTQIGGDPDFAFLMRQQLESWFQSGADEFIDSDTLDVYRLLGCDMSSSGDGDADDVDVGDGVKPVQRNSVLSRVSWVRAIGMLFWYSCSCVEAEASSDDTLEESFFLTTLTTLQVAVDQYINAVECGVAAEPRSPAAASGCDVSSSHAIFSLMLYCTGMVGERGERDESLERLISDCTGFTADPMDHRGSYLVLLLLQCQQRQRDENGNSYEPCHVSIVRQHVISELLYSGQWHWAVFVAMQIPDSALRDSAVRDIILRYAGGMNWESLDDGFSSFVVGRLMVPEVWVHEATAYRYCCDNLSAANSAQNLVSGGVGAFESAISCGDAEACSPVGRVGGGEAGLEVAQTNSFFRGKNMEVAYLGLAGLWGSDRANRIISAITGPYAIFSSTAAAEKLFELLLQVEQFVVFVDKDGDSSRSTWHQGSGALLAYLRFKRRYADVRTVLSEVAEAVALGQDGEFFVSARDELCELYRDAYELLSVLMLRHGKIWKARSSNKGRNTPNPSSPNFSTVSHIYLCDELYQCLCMLYSVLMSTHFRTAIDAVTFPDPLLLVNDPTAAGGSSSNDRMDGNPSAAFPILTKSYTTSMTSRLNSILTDRKNALPIDFVGMAY